jgi:FkbM family methyltransferase
MTTLRDRLLTSTALRVLKLPIQRSLRRIGYELAPISVGHSELVQGLLARHAIDLLVDVGANQGQFAQEFRAHGFTGSMCSFEPMEAAFRLLHRAAASDPGWTVTRTALGDKAGRARMDIAANSVSSSLLPITAAHVEAESASRTTGHEIVTVTTLDDQLRNVKGDALWLKLDVQGYEHQVLLGAKEALGRTEVVQCEMSFRELYAGQTHYLDLLRFLDAAGFVPVSVVPGLAHPLTGEAMQCDLLYVRCDTHNGGQALNSEPAPAINLR